MTLTLGLRTLPPLAAVAAATLVPAHPGLAGAGDAARRALPAVARS